MQRVRVRLIILWLICCTGCLGNNNLSTDQSLSTTTQRKQQSNTDLQLDINSSFLTKKQLIELKRSISSVLKDMRIIENNLLEPNLARDQLIDLQRKASKRMQTLEHRISKYIRQSVKLEKIKEQNSNKLTESKDQIEQQLISTNANKIISDKNFFFSSSSSSLSPSDFLYVDAVSSAAASTKSGNSSSNNFGNSFSSAVNYSSNSVSLNSSNSIDLPQSKIADFKSKLINKSNLPTELDLTGLTKEDLRTIQMFNLTSSMNESTNDKSIDKFAKVKNKFKNSYSTSRSNVHKIIDKKNRKQKHPFLLYHKCSEGYVQLNDDDHLNTGMNSKILANSELIINYLTKPHDHQLQIQTKFGKYLCFNNEGKPEIMKQLNESLCTFQIIYPKKEYIQLTSVLNSNWTLGFNKKGIPIRTTSHRLKKLRKIPKSCTLFIRQRSDKQLLQRLMDLNREQQEYNQIINAHNDQIKQIEQINDPLVQDSLIMAKIDQVSRRAT